LTNNIALAQPDKGEIALISYLGQLEKQHNVKFSYADASVADLIITYPTDSLSTIKAILTYLESKTNLTFHIIDASSIAISERTFNPLICGYILDTIDQKPIDGSRIIYGTNQVISDKSGYFQFRPDSTTATISIMSLGYSSRKINLAENSNTGCMTILLTPVVKQLKAVTIMKLLTNGLTKEPDGKILVDANELGLLPGLIEPDVLQTIQALPGIQSINETVSDINIRGGTNDQNLILWDGIKMYQTGHFFGLISAFNPYMYDNVRIIKNGTSAVYGDGVSGIIDIRSSNELNRKFSGGAGFNMLSADAFAEIPVSSKFAIQLAARRSLTDLIKTPIFNNYFARVFSNTEVTQNNSGSSSTFNTDEHFYFYDISTNLLWNLSQKDQVRIHLLTFYNNLEYQENVTSDSATNSRKSSLNQNSLATGVNYRRTWNSKFVTTAQLFLSSYLLNAINFNIPNDQRVTQENNVLDSGIILDALWLVNNKWDFYGGYQFFETGIGNLEEVNNPEFYRYIKQVIRSHAMFGEINLTLPEKGSYRLGLRGTYYEKFGKLILEPRLAIQYPLGQYFSLELLGEFKNQTATQVIDLQNDFLGVEKRRWVLANEVDIPIVFSKQVSTGISFQKTGLLLSLEAFYKYVNGITSASQGFQNQFQYLRTNGSYEVTGSEFLINQHYKDISWWLGYTLSTNKYYFPSLTPAEFANNLDINHTINFGLNWQFGSFESSVGVNWHTGKPYTKALEVVENEIVYGTPNDSRLPNYFRIDLSLRYHFNLSDKINCQISGSIWNLSNHTNIYNLNYTIDEAGTLAKVEHIALGITPNVSARINF